MISNFLNENSEESLYPKDFIITEIFWSKCLSCFEGEVIHEEVKNQILKISEQLK